PGADASTSALPIPAEAALLRAARSGGVPVAAVVVADDGPALGSPAMVVERLDGETIPRKLLRDDEWATARDRLPAQVADALARIHALPVAEVPQLPDAAPLRQLQRVHDALGQPHPAFELAFRWLAENRPPASRRAVVHGDLRL